MNSTSISIFMLTVTSATINGPDGDGDVRAEIAIELTNNSDRPIEFIASKTLVFSSEGLLVASDSDDNDDFIEHGETWPRELGSGYFKSTVAGEQGLEAQVEVLGCACNHHQLGSFALSTGSIVGLGQNTELGDGISLRSLTVSVSNPDGDGDVTVEVKALLDNASSTGFPKALLSGKITRSGREIEDISNYSDPVPANQLTLLEASSYLKQRQLSNATIDVRLSLFPVVIRETATASLS
jgi:hypothetical protein